MNREIIFFENHFMDFYLQLSPKAQEKVDFVLKLITTVKQVPEKFLKHLSGTDGLFEIRVEYQSNCFQTQVMNYDLSFNKCQQFQ